MNRFRNRFHILHIPTTKPKTKQISRELREKQSAEISFKARAKWFEHGEKVENS